MSDRPVISIDGLAIDTAAGVSLVRNVSLSVAAGEVVGVVGESGSGKSLTAFAVASLLSENVVITGGRIALEGRSLLELPETERRRVAGHRIGFVFQDPLSSFNPVRTVGSLLVESAQRHQGLRRDAATARAVEALRSVRLPDPERLIDAYPHELSGGQRQRAMLALALINNPVLLIADEPTTALDATVQMQILALLKRSAAGRATLMITHDLAVAAALCDRLVVMSRGEIVETGPTRQLLDAPQHPYTQQLLAASVGAATEAIA